MTPKDEWSVPWPDGSWLTWNDETESWEKQEGPPPADDAKPAPPATAKASKKATTAKAPATKAEPRKTPKPAPAPTVRLDLDDTPAETQTSSAWRPMTARPERAVERIPPTPAPRPVDPPRRPVRATSSRDLSLLPVIGAGCLAGIAAGYLVHFLIR